MTTGFGNYTVEAVKQGNVQFAVMSQNNNTTNQFWEIIPSPTVKGGVLFKNIAANKVMDLPEFKESNDTPVTLYERNDGKNQVWFLKPA